VDRDAVITGIRSRYADDYAKAWRAVIATAVVSRPSNVKDAASKLEAFSGNQSPILQVLRTTAMNTNTDSVTRLTFQPVHAVTPPDIVDKFVSEKNQPYQDGLLGLMGALNRVANLPPPAPNDTAATQAIVQAAQLAGGDVTNARVAEKKVAQGFTLTPLAAALANAVDRLLVAPIDGAEAALRTAGAMRVPTRTVVVAPPPKALPAPSGGGGGGGGGVPLSQVLNDLGQALCSSVRPIVGKFPFNADATSDVTMDELNALLAPNDGALWVFAQGRMKPFLEEKDGKWSGKAVGDVELSPAFVKFFNRAAEVSRALYSTGAATPTIGWDVEAVISAEQTPVVDLQFGTRRASFNTSTPQNVVTWPAGREAQLEATFKKNKPVIVSKGSGEWALFRLALPAKFDGMRGTWPATGKDAVPVVIAFEAKRGPQYPVLQRGWLGRDMSCVPQVTK
jgi:type VI secretion system protein ImpL